MVESSVFTAKNQLPRQPDWLFTTPLLSALLGPDDLEDLSLVSNENLTDLP